MSSAVSQKNDLPHGIAEEKVKWSNIEPIVWAERAISCIGATLAARNYPLTVTCAAVCSMMTLPPDDSSEFAELNKSPAGKISPSDIEQEVQRRKAVVIQLVHSALGCLAFAYYDGLLEGSFSPGLFLSASQLGVRAGSHVYRTIVYAEKTIEKMVTPTISLD